MIDIWQHIPVFFIILHIISLIFVIFKERKRPVSTISWVLTLTVLPVLGVLLYIFLSTARYINIKRKFSKKKLYDDALRQIIQSQLENIEHSSEDFCSGASANYLDMIKMNIKTGDSLYTDDNSLTLLKSAQEKYDEMFKDIKNAKKTINVMYYIFRNDNTGNKLIDLLTEKAKEGVEVRLIYDSFGNLKTPAKTFNRLKEAGGQVIRFLPQGFLNILRVNYRNHRKIVVIDGEIGYIGGINIGDEYLGLDKTKSPWRDTHLKIVGSAISSLQLQFLMDWQYLIDEKMDEQEAIAKFFSVRKFCGDSPVQIVSSGPDSPSQQIKYSFVKLISKAEKTLYVQTPYLIPDDTIIDGLKIAVNSGVDVRIMIPGVPDKKFVYYATLSYVEELLLSGVKVYRYDGFLHSKMLVSDGTACTLGTTNMDLRGFNLAFEINAFIYDSDFSKACEEMFLNDIKSCSEFELESFKKRSLWLKFKESIFRLLSPLM
ncbi:MAG: cardiolipin synthase [Clostridia bacterium]|nr:cardiolipin synthase [Clostridia bacterium]